LNVQRKSRPSPTENGCANLAPLWFCRYFDNNHAGFVASCILQRNVKVSVCFRSYLDNPADREKLRRAILGLVGREKNAKAKRRFPQSLTQRWIVKGEQSSLPIRIAVTGSGSLCERMKS
jgi:hypothetical protein